MDMHARRLLLIVSTILTTDREVPQNYVDSIPKHLNEETLLQMQ